MDAGADARPPPAATARLTAAANVTGAWAHLGWLCGRHMVAIQEHGLAQQRVRPFQLACRQKGAVAHLGPPNPEAKGLRGVVASCTAVPRPPRPTPRRRPASGEPMPRAGPCG
eukprot:15473908-Alexandrium_andersonii.AAC.1